MPFDPQDAQLTPEQLELAQAGFDIREAVAAQLADTDEDPGELDFDDILEIAMAEAGNAVRVVMQAIAMQGTTEDYARLLLGAGAGAMNAIHADSE